MSSTTEREKQAPRPVRRPGDRIFEGLSTSAGILILLTLLGVAIFLTLEGLPGITASADEIGGKTGGKGFFAYVWPLVFGTVWAAVIALLIAVPVAIGVALYISHYAPRRLSATLGYVIDLLAAVPSVVYGLWGLLFLSRELAPFYQWLADNLGFIPFFAGNPSGGVSANSILTASLVLAVMVLPIITAICREIFLQTPRLHEEAALALGATRWEMVRMSVFPYARSGIVSASMLGLGRALGETMAVAMVLSASGIVTFNLIGSTNPSTIAANIALQFPEAFGTFTNVLIATGLVLFVITFAANFAARAIVERRKDFSGAN
ncbi:MAG: phosphate ABC transporter permease subunit PstC [Aeromicrobium sp.]|uniref:phosphate ABC transporter permease subunit PstC n=1 Tax=Aeromicrobium sp. TaxID=1871063 RepID=UPI0025C3F4F8|nr:phosphate ABC transporter permease subunit PstC [Aeromicrobium sp.]MCK5891426.1 phosphate ABC transporter permease subunit PstC [Aeromicrobium sp.]MDF1704428.1 phosphate ABC transporter permease subunit PstC [Aeromicrobium sp.]